MLRQFTDNVEVNVVAHLHLGADLAFVESAIDDLE
jgi:hypothetical protein